MRLAIVGSTVFEDRDWRRKARHLICDAIETYRPEAVITGGAAGIDTLAEFLAHGYGYRPGRTGQELIVHRPANRRWEPDGFKARNLLIVEDCTHLLAIRCHASRTYGSGWTADRAQERYGADFVRREVL